MGRPPQLSVIGYDNRLCTKAAFDAAYLVGKEAAERGATIINGGLGGVMEAASRGAKEAGGTSVAILPTDDTSQANDYAGSVVATGFGFARNFAVVYSGDAVIVIGGGAGTLIETAAAYQKAKPIVALRGTGGVADAWGGRYIDERRIVRVVSAENPAEAVKKALQLASRRVRGAGAGAR